MSIRKNLRQPRALAMIWLLSVLTLEVLRAAEVERPFDGVPKTHERIRVAAISGAANVMQERIQLKYSCGAQVIPGLLQYGDVPEIGSLIAPRPCVWEIGSRDGLINPQWANEAMDRVARAYRAAGETDRLHVDRFEGGHVFHGKIAYPLFDEILRPRE